MNDVASKGTGKCIPLLTGIKCVRLLTIGVTDR